MDGIYRNLNTTGTTTYTYDFENRPISSTINGQTTTHTYDGDGNRVKKIDSQGTVNYLVDTNNNTGFSQVILETDGTGNIITSYIYGDDLICQKREEGAYYYLYDGLGSTRNFTDNTGNITDSYWYYGFGELLNKTGTTPNNYLFTGEQFDPNVGFYYLRARYYNPEIGRFITTDPVEGSIYEPISLHKYLYANLDPVNKIDPSGEFTIGEMLSNIHLALTTITRQIYMAWRVLSWAERSAIIAKGIWSGQMNVWTSGLKNKSVAFTIGFIGGATGSWISFKNPTLGSAFETFFTGTFNEIFNEKKATWKDVMWFLGQSTVSGVVAYWIDTHTYGYYGEELENFLIQFDVEFGVYVFRAYMELFED